MEYVWASFSVLLIPIVNKNVIFFFLLFHWTANRRYDNGRIDDVDVDRMDSTCNAIRKLADVDYHRDRWTLDAGNP